MPAPIVRPNFNHISTKLGLWRSMLDMLDEEIISEQDAREIQEKLQHELKTLLAIQ